MPERPRLQAGPTPVPPGAAWVLPALGLLQGGTAYVLAAAWRHLYPHAAPPPGVVVAGALVVTAVACSLAVSFALHPAKPTEWWRPALALLCAATALPAVLTAPGHLVPVAVAAVALMALAARGGETVGRHLAPALAVPGDDPHGDWAAQGPETRRLVLETWVCAALAAAAVHGPAATAALVLSALGGLTLTAGVALGAADRPDGPTGEGFTWEAPERAAAWRGAAALGGAAVLLAALIPALPPLRSPRLYGWLPAALAWLLRPTPRRLAAARHLLPLPSGTPAAPLPFTAGAGAGRTTAAIHLGDIGAHRLVIGVIAAVLLLLLVELLAWRPEFRAAIGRLGRSLVAAIRWRQLWRSLWLWGRREPAWNPPSGADPGGPERVGHRPGGLATLTDPRLAVRAAYRRYLRAAHAAGHGRAPAESPAAHLRRLGPLLEHAAPDARALTAGYQEARFSAHPIPAAGLPGLRAALRRLLRLLRGPFRSA